MSIYRQRIREILAAQGRIGTDPAHVEAWMRLEHGTLDGLSAAQFAREVSAAVECIEASTPDENRRLADSYGLSS
jgi:hypothetical protein